MGSRSRVDGAGQTDRHVRSGRALRGVPPSLSLFFATRGAGSLFPSGLMVSWGRGVSGGWRADPPPAACFSLVHVPSSWGTLFKPVSNPQVSKPQGLLRPGREEAAGGRSSVRAAACSPGSCPARAGQGCAQPPSPHRERRAGGRPAGLRLHLPQKRAGTMWVTGQVRLLSGVRMWWGAPGNPARSLAGTPTDVEPLSPLSLSLEQSQTTGSAGQVPRQRGG